MFGALSNGCVWRWQAALQVELSIDIIDALARLLLRAWCGPDNQDALYALMIRGSEGFNDLNLAPVLPMATAEWNTGII